MPESVKHRIFIGNTSPAIDEPDFNLKPDFTFDRTDITFDTVLRTFDETV